MDFLAGTPDAVYYGRREKIMNKEVVLAVLERAAGVDKLICQLTDDFTEAVKDYESTCEKHAALFSGNVRWIETHIGRLDNRLRTWLNCRLRQERW